MAGREVIKKGIGWLIGSGKDIGVWQNPWLSLKELISPMGPHTLEHQTLTVADLLHPNYKEWNLPVIRSILPQYEDAIRELVPCWSSSRDERVWLFTKSGEYSTKSGCKVLSQPLRPPEQHFNWNTNIWKVDTTPKVRTFLWKLQSGALPATVNLAARGIMINTACKRCGAPETDKHIFLHCPFARRTWELVPSVDMFAILATTTTTSLLNLGRGLVNLPPTGLICPLYPWVLWYLWKTRNK